MHDVSAALVTRRDVSHAMRPEFDDNGVFPGSMWAPLWRTPIVKLNAAARGVSFAFRLDVVANR